MQDILSEVGQDGAAAEFVLRSMDPAQAVQRIADTIAPASASAADATGSDGSTDDGSAAVQDFYTKHRRDANKLTRRWRKAVRAASAAFQAGDHSGGCIQRPRHHEQQQDCGSLNLRYLARQHRSLDAAELKCSVPSVRQPLGQGVVQHVCGMHISRRRLT